jgi:uncharacterized protein YjbI with pentapeptide repeats
VWGALIEANDVASDASHAVWEECRVVTVGAEVLDHLMLTGTTLRDVVIDELRAVQISARGSRWREVEVRATRAGTLDAGGAEWNLVTVRGLRADYLNLGTAQLRDVTFVDCVFGTVDLPAARLTRVRFEGCRAEEVDTRELHAEHLDLRGLDVASFTDIRGLRGATLSMPQVHAHSAAFAAGVGIRVED